MGDDERSPGVVRQLIRNEKTTVKFLAAVEYELWILRHSIWLGTPNGKYERHF
ncbi:hypothetical protein [Coleofasciculus sp.]|uniref:hypothetical protein n=1 Tax=Coleofasciculus sp. TaxID=3100458 RepID=UPI003A2EAD41